MPVLGLGVYLNEDPVPACLAALKHGYRHIDSARMYRNEAAVGRAVKESGVPREQVFVTSKIYDPEHGYESTLRAVQDSLDKFGFNYLDLYLIHSPLSGKTKRLETYKALLRAKEEGKLKSIGVSNYSPKHIDEIKEAGLELPAVNQVELHPFCQQKPIVEYCRAHNIVVQAYSPLVRGKLDDAVITALAQKYGKTPAQIAVRWSLQKGFVPLPKSANPERVVANAQVFDFSLADEDVAKLDALDRGKAGAVTWNPVDAE
ncbi:Aldo/keto reductase [Gloeophyllum trabeum ATCC 11539]|uniref:Aldo/keto reductase n=1 Tax=Gloeophyllum trabeum (strain ATCC 11539 / FP-39264 / Madison 617) TaxID=670483 RepID=S7PZ28_GLOTA|nr:Aldo/keto reductase [Gloeophyllum trabeum ATCC 11539]EPQ52901.1 Aldo/keto reductase [Gloeophyllum trabeum ATCC 11539]